MSVSGSNTNKAQRRRTTRACDTCRSRRTKCDCQRPVCWFCEQHGSQCLYQEPIETPPSKLEQDISAIREQLSRITNLLSPPQPRQDHELLQHAPNRNGQVTPVKPSSNSFEKVDFPYMTIKMPLLMNVLGIHQDLGVSLLNMERSDLSGTPSVSQPRVFMLQGQRLSAAYSEKIHIWYPILHPNFTEDFLQVISGSVPLPAQSCLALMVAAIGSLAEYDSISAALSDRPDTAYFNAAIALVPNVISECSIRSLQCIVLLSIYYLCLVKPCQAHDYALIASFKAQNIIRSRMYVDDAATLELVWRAYWAILLIESELNVQLDLVESGIWKHDDHIPLPSIQETWQYTGTSPQAGQVTSPESLTSFRSTSDEMLAYFLAEISMRRMLQRCTSSVSNISNGKFVYAPIIAMELELQLDEWYSYLPGKLRFARDPMSDEIVGATSLSQFLKAQYMACKASIYWPAVYQSFVTGEAGPNILPFCVKFFDSYTSFIDVVHSVINQCQPNVWTLYSSVFVITMAANRTIVASCLDCVITPAVLQAFQIAANKFGDVCACSPSLSALQSILQRALTTRGASQGPKGFHEH